MKRKITYFLLVAHLKLNEFFEKISQRIANNLSSLPLGIRVIAEQLYRFFYIFFQLILILKTTLFD